MLRRLTCIVTTLTIAAVLVAALFILLNTPGAVAQGDLPDMDALGRYHFEYGTTQGWFAQPGESQLGITITVTATTAPVWTGNYSLRVGVVSDTVGAWWAAAGVDNPAPGMTPTGTLTAHLYQPITSTVTWAKLYILTSTWGWSESPTVTLQPGDWVTLTWDLIGVTIVPTINRFGVQFGGTAAGAFSDALYLDAIDWSQPTYSQTIYTGAYLSGTWTANFANELDCLDDAGGKNAGLINVFVGWTGPFPTGIVNTILCHKGTPMITWEPWVPLTDVVDGVYDTYINEWASAITQTQSTVFLRWGHEMNGCLSDDPSSCWYPWGGDPENYKDAWRYVHDHMEITSSVRNAVWVWTPNITQGDLFTDYPDYYPGDDYVDWVGASGFNTAQKAWWAPKPPCFTFDDLFSPILHDMTDRYPKPQIVPEFASACDNSCNKVLWISEAYHQALFYPRLQALVWFNVAKWEGEGAQREWVDWRIGCGDCDTPACPDCVAAYARALANPRYSDGAPGSIACKLYLPLILKNR
jgi:hypothetical protein